MGNLRERPVLALEASNNAFQSKNLSLGRSFVKICWTSLRLEPSSRFVTWNETLDLIPHQG